MRRLEPARPRMAYDEYRAVILRELRHGAESADEDRAKWCRDALAALEDSGEVCPGGC